jgi:hypothetical protein
MAGPIKPGDAEALKAASMPDAVFDAFNKLIAENLSCGTALVRQTEVVSLIVQKLECTRAEVFERGWLNVEGQYRKAGWKVEYDKPAYNESHEAFFRFTKK